MTQNNKLLFFMSLLIFISINAQNSKLNIPILPDWRKDTFGYAEKLIPQKIKSGNNGELIAITLKKAYITKADNDPVVLAICAVERDDKETSSLTYFLSAQKQIK